MSDILPGDSAHDRLLYVESVIDRRWDKGDAAHLLRIATAAMEDPALRRPAASLIRTTEHLRSFTAHGSHAEQKLLEIWTSAHIKRAGEFGQANEVRASLKEHVLSPRSPFQVAAADALWWIECPKPAAFIHRAKVALGLDQEPSPATRLLPQETRSALIMAVRQNP